MVPDPARPPGGRREDESDEDPSVLSAMARLSGHGITIALSTGLFLLGGWWVDQWLGTTPLFTITGALVGGAAGFYSLLQHLLFFPKQQEEEDARSRGRQERDERKATGADEP